MRLHHTLPLIFAFLSASLAHASEKSWMFQPAWYTHSPTTGERVAQYQPERPSYVTVDPTYQESGYRHELYAVGNEISNVIKTWGAGTAIRPYGEWEFPFRAGATPYGPWGNPQGPWTLPFDSWQNPYGQFNRQPYFGPWQQPGYGNGGNHSGWAPGNPSWQQPQPMPHPQPMPAGGAGMPGAVNVPPPPMPDGQGQGM